MSAAAVPMSGAEETRERASCDRVDVWQVALEPWANETALRTLSEPEREHAVRLRVGAASWVAARAALRRIVGRYLGIAPQAVAFATGANGKPRLAPGASVDLRFNLSHSGNIALIAVRLGQEVGIDVEELRPGIAGAAIARDVFTDHERAALAASVADEGFFRVWVRREALAKAIGLGVVFPPDADEVARFQVTDLECAPGFVAALASEGAAWCVRPVAGE